MVNVHQNVVLFFSTYLLRRRNTFPRISKSILVRCLPAHAAWPRTDTRSPAPPWRPPPTGPSQARGHPSRGLRRRARSLAGTHQAPGKKPSFLFIAK
jgi:hypothetical protein